MDTGSLDLAVRAVAPADGLFVLPADYDAPQSWRLVTRTDGVRVRVDYRPEATGEQIAAGDAVVMGFDFSASAEADRVRNRLRASATNQYDSGADIAVLADRAIALTALDEINTLRRWIAAFVAAVAASTSLADLKTRVAALPATPNRSTHQLKTAILSKITGGLADTP